MEPCDFRSRSTITLLAAFGVIVALFTYSFRLVRVQGVSMEPTYHPGQWLLVRRLNWPAFPISHSDVVVFRQEGDVLVKRVAALPGDVPPVDDLRILRFLCSSPDHHLAAYSAEVAKSLMPVPNGHLFVLGDNADRSDDSRRFGPIPAKALIGRVIQWNAPEPPEQRQVGYTRPRQTHRLASAAATAGGVLASAKIGER